MPLRRSIDGEIVKAFWTHMLTTFGARVERKQTSWFMKIIGWILQLVRLIKAKDFQNRWVTTIGNTIYIPFEIGIEDNGWDLWNQIVVCAHEIVHVIQHRDAPSLYEFEYLLQSRMRFLFEVEAYSRNIELYYWRFHQLLDVTKLQKALEKYGWHTQADSLFSKHELEEEIALLKAYGLTSITNIVSSKAIRWLDYTLGAHYGV